MLHKLIMKLIILQIICLINYVVTFPNDLFGELWQTNQSEPQANDNLIEYKPKIKVEPHEEQFDGKWRDESALKGIVKVEHLGAVNVEGKLEDHVKEEDQDGEAPNISDQKNNEDEIMKQKFDEIYDKNWSEDETHSAPSADDLDQENSAEAEHLSDQNNSTDQYESVNEQQNESNKYQKIESDQQKLKILKQFDEIKSKCKKAKFENILMRELDRKIAKKLGFSKTTIYEWKRKFGLSVGKKKFSELEKRKILKQFDEIKSKCKKAKLTNILMRELDGKIAKKFGFSKTTIYEWKRTFGLSVGKKKLSDETKIGILKKYSKMKRNNPKMSDCAIADLLKISRKTISKWKVQFSKENKQL